MMIIRVQGEDGRGGGGDDDDNEKGNGNDHIWQHTRSIQKR